VINLEIYLDNSATTKPYREVCEQVFDTMYRNYGNPSSLHTRGISAECAIKTAAAEIAATLKCAPSEIIFTSGGTEANNLAIFGGVRASRGKHIITSSIEHPATIQALAYMKDSGYTVDPVGVDGDGNINLNELAGLITSDTALVTVMQVNNEIGTVAPVEQIGRLIKSKNPNTLFHIDAVQAYCKIPVTPQQCYADMISVSSHKIHGPKGVGALYVKSGTKIVPVIYGGGQQNNIRPGTENVAGIAGFGLAARMAFDEMNKNSACMAELRDMLEDSLVNNIDGVHVNTPGKNSAPHILNVSFAGVKSEVLLHSLEAEGIFVSSGSACSSHKKGAKSYVLRAIGLEDRWIDGSIRFSLSEFISAGDIRCTAEKVRDIVRKLRR